MSSALSDTTVIIPTLNEERSIVVLIEEILQTAPDLRIIVTDDNSTDQTIAKVNELSEQRPEQIGILIRQDAAVRGITASVLDALDRVQTTYCVVMDGDLQHPPGAITEMIEALVAGADLAAGYRLPYSEKQALHRVAATRVSTWLAKRILKSRGLDIRDPMSGFFAVRTAVIRDIVERHADRFAAAGYKILFDLLRTAGARLKIAEVPYEFRLRLGGKSKLAPRHGWIFLRSLRR